MGQTGASPQAPAASSILGSGQKVILAPKLQSGMLKPGVGLNSSGSSILNLPVLGPDN